MTTRRDRRPRDPIYMRRKDLDPIDRNVVHDDDQNTDHTRLDDMNRLARVRLIDALDRRSSWR